MKIAYVTCADATHGNEIWYYIAKSLKSQSLKLDYLGPLTTPFLDKFSLKSKYHFYKAFFDQWHSRERDKALLKNYARQISRKLADSDADIVLSPNSPGSQPIAYLECEQPIVIWTDVTLSSVIDFYPDFFRDKLAPETLRDGLENERSALSRSSLLIYTSDWAAESAIRYYQLDPAKVKVVSTGPCIECHRDLDDIKLMLNAKPANVCKLLFLGRDWIRKGGDIALQVTKELNESGLPTELTIVGCEPSDDELLPEFVRVMKSIDKSTPAGFNVMNQLFSETHFLILPTLADCTPNVFPEANSFGIPCLTTNVGGIPTIVVDHVNGKTFDKSATASDYCRYISTMFDAYSQYRKLALSSFNEYKTRLNWTVAGRKLKDLLVDLDSKSFNTTKRNANAYSMIG